MSRTLLLMVSLVCAVLMFGCATTENTNNSNSNSNSTTPGSEKSGTAPSSVTPGAATASSDDKIGVPECDEFMTKYDACVSNKVPEMVRVQYKEALARARSDMRARANDPATRSTMASYCKQALEQAKTSMTAFNCAW